MKIIQRPWAAEVAGSSRKHTLQIGLGVLWFIAALLQMQPGMFHPAFYGNLSDSTMPSLLQQVEESTVGWAIPAMKLTQAVYIHAPIVTNLAVICVQLCLAAVLLLPVLHRFIPLALWGSILWGVCVWVFGEGLGGLFSLGDMTFYEGFPGSALLYAASGAFLLLSSAEWDSGRASRLLRYTLTSLFAVCGFLQAAAFNQQWDKATLMSVFANSGFQYQPHLLSAPIMRLTIWISAHTITANTILVLLLFAAAFVVYYWPRLHRSIHFLFYVWLFLSWWFGMDFGYLFSGLSTDLNTAPIVGLLVHIAGQGTSELPSRAKMAPLGY